jgi:integrase
MLWGMSNTTYKSRQRIRVAENLYRKGDDRDAKYKAVIKRDGRLHEKTFETTELAIAKRMLRDFEKEVEEKCAVSSDLTFEQLCERWKDSVRAHMKPKSLKRRESAINAMTPFFGGLKLRQIGREQAQDWSEERGEMSERTYNIEHETIKTLFKYASEHRLKAGTNPIDGISRRKEGKAIVIPPTREEFGTLLDTMNAEPKAKESVFLVQLLAYSGMRVNEARHVQWKHVDFKRDTLLITSGADGNKNHEQREIPLFPALRELLLERGAGKPNEYLVEHDDALTALVSASGKMGIAEGEHFTHHKMRHFFASNALENPEVTFPVLAGWLGHKDGGILAAKTYGHLRKGHSHSVAKFMTFSYRPGAKGQPTPSDESETSARTPRFVLA